MTPAHAVVAVKGLERGKNRLAEALTEKERHLLITTMLSDVIGALRATRGIASINVLSSDSAVLPKDVEPIVDPGEGLNAAVAHAASVLSNDPSLRTKISCGRLQLRAWCSALACRYKRPRIWRAAIWIR